VHATFDVRIFYKECRTLARAGYDVVLVAPHDRAEFVDGVRIQPVGRNLNRWNRMTKTVWEVFRKAWASHADIYHFHDPELLPLGVVLKLTGKSVIYDVHEDVASDILSKYWIHPWLRRPISTVMGLVEQMAARTFDAVVVATPAIASRFSPKQRVLVQNFPVATELAKVAKTPYRLRKANVLYMGAISEMRGAREMVAAIRKVPDRLAARLLLLGEVEPESLAQELRLSPGWDKVEYLGLQKRSALPGFAETARVGVVLFHPVPNYGDAQPNKLFEYMSAGLPVIASNFPVWRTMIEDVGCGVVVDPLRPDEIAEAVSWMLDHPTEAEAMGRRGQQAVSSKYNWDTQANSLLALYERLA
jgi:glycosyltransferase involved in cell wall biosynthesis